MSAFIQAVEYSLPEASLTNDDLSSIHPEWKVDKLSRSTGIVSRQLAMDNVLSSDLATSAARVLFDRHHIDPREIDYLILCTQSPDFALPTTACIVHGQLDMRTDVGAIDITLGCSGYVYALGLAKALIESGQVRNVLVLTAETHSKFANPDDKATRPIFGDGGTASLVSNDLTGERSLEGFTLRTDGAGGPNLVVPSGGLRPGETYSIGSSAGSRGLTSNGYDMFMDGVEIFNFTLRVVPQCVADVLERANIGMEDVDLFIFHQANGFLIEHLRKKLEIPPERFVVALENYGNTGSSTIPIALADSVKSGRVRRGDRVMLVGFGVGLSWGGALATW